MSTGPSATATGRRGPAIRQTQAVAWVQAAEWGRPPDVLLPMRVHTPSWRTPMSESATQSVNAAIPVSVEVFDALGARRN